MKPELLKDPNLAIESTTLFKTKKTYQLASLTKVFFARLFDLLIIALPQFLLGYFVPARLGDWTNVGIVMPTTLMMLIVYFMVFPIFLKGNTIGKLLLNIRLRTADESGKIKWYSLIVREAYFWLIPWTVSLIATSIAVLILQSKAGDDTFHFDAYLVYNLGYIFFILWFAILGFSIKVQKEHQSGIDIRFNLYVVEKNPLDNLKKVVQPKSEHYDHVALNSMPGNFDHDKLVELIDDEQKKFDRSINLTNLDKKPKLKQLSTHQDLLETKSKKKGKK